MRNLAKTISASVLAGLIGTGAATAADPVTVPYVAPTVYAPAPVQTWDGVFVGVFGGGGIGQAYHLTGPMNNIGVAGGVIGATVGGNFYLTDSVLLGAEADIAWMNLTGSTTTFGGNTSTHTFNVMGSVRAVLGYDAGMFMPYITGGPAFTQGTRTSTAGAPNSASASHFGYAVGAGVQVAVTDNVILDLRYLYSEYLPAVYDWSGPGVNPTIGPELNTVTLGVKMPLN